MQKRYLRIFLLILLIFSCSPRRMTEENRYLFENKAFVDRHSAEFSLNTENDSLNKAFAALSLAIVDSIVRIVPASKPSIETVAQFARAGWLVRREVPEICFPRGLTFTEDDRLRWGENAYAAVMDYGMARGDSFYEFVYASLSGLSRLHAEYVGSSPEILEDNISPDSLTDLASAQVRYAALMTLGERICMARGDYEGEITYRTDAARAFKSARLIFDEANDRYRLWLGRKQHEESRDFFDTQSADVTPSELHAKSLEPPDTLAYLQTGAQYGFRWLSGKPRELMTENAQLDGVIWQRWTKWRFLDSLALKETPVLDSLVAIILHGPNPGWISRFPNRVGPPSLAVQSILYEDLSELYLGVQPDFLTRTVKIEPRLPESWGHTMARVPLAEGYLHLDIELSKNRFKVSSERISDSLQVFLGYPLKIGGWARTQFWLSADEPEVEVLAEIDSENRVRLTLKRD